MASSAALSAAASSASTGCASTGAADTVSAAYTGSACTGCPAAGASGCAAGTGSAGAAGAGSAGAAGAVGRAAARGADGRLGILVTRYNDDNNITSPDRCVIRLARGAFARPARAALTDDARLNTLTRLVPEADGSLVLSLEPNAFVYVEY